MIFLSILSLSIGVTSMSFREVVFTLFGVNDDYSLRNIVINIRLPRLLSAIIIGMSLSISGAAMQTLFKNPLIDPYIGGIAAGAALGATSALLFGMTLLSPASPYAIPFAAFIGSIAALFLTILFSRLSGASPLSFILSGIAVNFLFSSATTIVVIVSSERAYGVLFWHFGSLVTSSWRYLKVTSPIALIVILCVLLYARKLNVLLLDDEAQVLGINVKFLRYFFLVILSLLTALVVSFNGIIGFVGLVAPHIARLIVGGDHRLLLPMSILIGSLILLSADIVARIAIAPAELPIGAITSFIGVPFFLHLLLRRSRRYG